MIASTPPFEGLQCRKRPALASFLEGTPCCRCFSGRRGGPVLMVVGCFMWTFSEVSLRQCVWCDFTVILGLCMSDFEFMC